MKETDETLLKAEIDEIAKRIAETMKNLEGLDIFNKLENPEQQTDSA